MLARRPTRRGERGTIARREESSYSPDEVKPATREETLPVALAAILLATIALVVSYSRGYMLLYGDAVAHLGIARRIIDSRYPGLSQLGGVWLPLPHLLMVPFVQRMDWWQSGLAGAWPSLFCYIVGAMGFYRLVRRMVTRRWSFAATAFYLLNPNLLYLSTTAMTEALFLAILVWTTLLTMEYVQAVRDGRASVATRRMLLLGLLVMAAVFTRYDGWILGAAVWCVVSWQLYRHREHVVKLRAAYMVFTVLCVAGPLLWLGYNQHFYGDPLDFMRGPYSAAAIEKRTTAPGAKHYPGWHDPLWALVLYTRVAQLDAAVWETGFVVMAAALWGLVVSVRRRLEPAWLLLWIPLPFYVYSIAFGSVPLFIPPFEPHSYYNSRYGMEMLPALVAGTFVALDWLWRRVSMVQPLVARLLYPVSLSLAALNCVGMMHWQPLVLKEAMVNSTTRIAFESAVARVMNGFPRGVPIMMYTSDHIGAVQQAGRPLKEMVSELDRDSWKIALEAPADHAAYVIAVAGDPVAKAVEEHPQGLTELTVLCTTGQSCARIYQSDRFSPISH